MSDAKLFRPLAHDVVPLVHATFTDRPWLDGTLTVAHPADARLIKQHARWVHLDRLQRLADAGCLSKGDPWPRSNPPPLHSTISHTSAAQIAPRQRPRGNFSDRAQA
ncbi:hypothetical protein [Microbacterium excoecariae]|uniref:hypothetical protein n=1 Tax=Microbacterium excoecariae TaxID=2715210 RepID=UPI00140E3F54|nr:hypothetical protein [Microbacterium excoecariae]NHI17068.1 hypothetical protein [Microbacterium excoecariae]